MQFRAMGLDVSRETFSFYTGLVFFESWIIIIIKKINR